MNDVCEAKIINNVLFFPRSIHKKMPSIAEVICGTRESERDGDREKKRTIFDGFRQ